MDGFIFVISINASITLPVSFLIKVTVLVSTRVFSTEKETHGKMAASMSAHVSMPRWENTNVYPSKLSIMLIFTICMIKYDYTYIHSI